MRLTLQTDYSLRVLIHLACVEEGMWTPVSHIALAYKISRTHLTKVTQRLTQIGYLESRPGRGGGVRLARSPDTIVIGEVVRNTEPSLAPVPCLEATSTPSSPGCVIASACGLKLPLAQARDAFLEALDKHTLDQCITRRQTLCQLLQIPTRKDH